jgi:hypothetical protein
LARTTLAICNGGGAADVKGDIGALRVATE